MAKRDKIQHPDGTWPTKTGKHPGGRLPSYSDVVTMQAAIDQYFESCDGEMILDSDGIPATFQSTPSVGRATIWAALR